MLLFFFGGVPAFPSRSQVPELEPRITAPYRQLGKVWFGSMMFHDLKKSARQTPSGYPVRFMGSMNKILGGVKRCERIT